MTRSAAKSDHEEIRNLLGRYARAVDERDFEGVRQCFTADAVASYSGLEIPPGVENIVDHIRGVSRTRMSQHFIQPIIIDVEGDEAESFSYAMAVLIQGRDGRDHSLARGLRYTDKLRRTSEGWQIYHRHHDADWSWELPVLIDPGAMWEATPSRDGTESIYR